MKRLPRIDGEWLDRTKSLEFHFEGQRFTGYQGDTIASALAANGVHLVGRSFKYHRPRGLFSAANHDVNAMFQVAEGGRTTPNVRGDVEPLRAGIQVAAVNTDGGLANDRLARMERLARFLPVGFYYKAFHGKWFPRWERLIRRTAGLGFVDTAAPRLSTPKRYLHADVLVIGAGPSGMSAALAAAESGADVVLVDETARPGGSGLYALSGKEVDEQIVALVGAVSVHPRIRFMRSTYAAGYYADHWVALVAPDYLIKARARAVVIAQGAVEQPAVFRGNDLPGVMLASGAQRLICRYAVAPATRVAVLTANAEGYVAALGATSRGIAVAAVLDLRAAAHASEEPMVKVLRERGVAVQFGVSPVQARARMDHRVCELEFDAWRGGAAQRQRIVIDGVWMSVGFAPANHLLHQAGAKMRYERAIEQFVPAQLPSGVFACGKVAGQYDVGDRLSGGAEAGREAAAHARGGHSAAEIGADMAVGTRAATDTEGAESPVATQDARSVRDTGFSRRASPSHPYPIFPHASGKEFVDLDEDLQIADLANAVQEGFDSSELLKRYSTVGMGPSQGKHSNSNAMRILAKLRNESVETIGPTTARPMFHPVPLAHLAGRGFHPHRQTALHGEHEKLGAVWMPAGDWQRPEYYARAGESRDACIEAEVKAVRTGVGIIDVGTLGKIEAHGAGAGEFLDRAYTARFSTLKIGMTRYGLLLDEAGVIVDDGVIARLGEERFYFTTTTGNSGALFREFARLATWWQLPVGLVNLTGHFAALNLAGPRSRAVLAELTKLDLSNTAFPYLGVREAEVAGVRCRLMRVGFVGELGYEIHMPADDAVHVWSALMKAGDRCGIRPFGVEAQRVLRLEKGNIIIGQDTDGLTNPIEINARWALKMSKPFFVGQRSLQILERRARRQQLIGFKLTDGTAPRPKEAQLVIDNGLIAGRITSIVNSPALGCAIGLALVDPAVARRSHLQVRIAPDREITVAVTSLPFYDPNGDRQRRDDAQAEKIA